MTDISSISAIREQILANATVIHPISCAGYQQVVLDKGNTFVPLTQAFQVILEAQERCEGEEKKTWYVAKLIDVHHGLQGMAPNDIGRRTLQTGEATDEDPVTAKVMAMNALLEKTAWEVAKADMCKGKKDKKEKASEEEREESE